MNLTGVDFSAANLKNVNFDRTILTGSKFIAEGSPFSSSYLSIQVIDQLMKNASITDPTNPAVHFVKAETLTQFMAAYRRHRSESSFSWFRSNFVEKELEGVSESMRGLVFLKHIQEKKAIYAEKGKNPARTLTVLDQMDIQRLDRY